MSMSISPAGVLHAVITALNDAGVPHMVVGSFASTVHGAERSTQDIDILIDPTPESLEAFTSSLQHTDMYVSPSAQSALRERDQFNVISPSTGWKVDLIIRQDREFDRSRLARRQPVDLYGVQLWLASAEDTILAKLEWARMGESERQLHDVARVLKVKQDALDTEYISRWADALGVTDLLEQARKLAGDI